VRSRIRRPASMKTQKLHKIIGNKEPSLTLYINRHFQCGRIKSESDVRVNVRNFKRCPRSLSIEFRRKGRPISIESTVNGIKLLSRAPSLTIQCFSSSFLKLNHVCGNINSDSPDQLYIYLVKTLL